MSSVTAFLLVWSPFFNAPPMVIPAIATHQECVRIATVIIPNTRRGDFHEKFQCIEYQMAR